MDYFGGCCPAIFFAAPLDLELPCKGPTISSIMVPHVPKPRSHPAAAVLELPASASLDSSFSSGVVALLADVRY